MINEGVDVYTLHNLYKILHQVLQEAENTGLAQRNVTKLVSCPRISMAEMKYWTEA